jgi:tetratricopeptide (TPR) repeat protein
LMPSNAVPFNGRGKAQLALKRPAGAMRDFSRAIVLNPRYGQAFANRAEALVALHRYHEAVGDYTSALEFGNVTARIYRGRASVYMRLKKPGLALADAARARDRDPSVVTVAAAARGLPDRAGRSKLDIAAPMRTPTSDTLSPPVLACEQGLTGLPDEARSPGAQVADAFRNLPASLVYRTNGGFLETTEESPTGDFETRAPMSCDFQGRDAIEASAELASAGQQAEPAERRDMDDWFIERSSGGDYVAARLQHPANRVTLEMYGEGAPALLHWLPLKGGLRGIGLLHYDAGASPEGERLEYVAIIDTWSGRLIAIEPCRWGERQADWTWSELGVMVIDPEGVPSRVQLREHGAYDPTAHLKLRRVKRVSRPMAIRERMALRGRPWQAKSARFRSHAGRFDPWHFR